MTMNLKALALAAATASSLSAGVLAITTVPASAREVCDRDGDDCRETHSWYRGGDWDDWRRHEWHERREWEERRERERYREWYWNQRPYYYGNTGYGGGGVWYNF